MYSFEPLGAMYGPMIAMSMIAPAISAPTCVRRIRNAVRSRLAGRATGGAAAAESAEAAAGDGVVRSVMAASFAGEG
jgi:hypothetical protein